jgi:hypothetical protein
MKKSEKLKQKADTLDNDLAYLGAMNKVMRQERVERFEPWLEELKTSSFIISIVSDLGQGKHTITTKDYGVIDYFPKANKLLIRKNNNWIQPGLKWIVTNLIN